MFFFANRFLFSIKGTCYSVLMQFTIRCHPKLMAKILVINVKQLKFSIREHQICSHWQEL